VVDVQVYPATVDRVGRNALRSNVVFLLTESLKTLSEVPSPIDVLTIYVLDLHPRSAAHLVYRVQYALLNRQNLAFPLRNRVLNLIVELRSGLRLYLTN
jgi:hypothetical protein